MAALDAKTELFDLFGEEGTCTICQDDLREGERVRAVRACQHTFHATCLDPWLLSKGTCPMCRGEVIRVDQSAEVIRDSNSTLQALYSALQGNRSQALNAILNQVEQLIQQTSAPLTQAQATAAAQGPQAQPLIRAEPLAQGPQAQPLAQQALALDRKRHILSYVLSKGIRKRFRTAAAFNPVRTAMRIAFTDFTLDGTRIFPLDYDSRAAFERSYRAHNNEVQRILETTSHSEVRQVRARLQFLSGTTEALRLYWQA